MAAGAGLQLDRNGTPQLLVALDVELPVLPWLAVIPRAEVLGPGWTWAPRDGPVVWGGTATVGAAWTPSTRWQPSVEGGLGLAARIYRFEEKLGAAAVPVASLQVSAVAPRRVGLQPRGRLALQVDLRETVILTDQGEDGWRRAALVLGIDALFPVRRTP